MKKKWNVHWYNIDEVVKTDQVEANTKEEAEREAKKLYVGKQWPAPLCSATEC